MTENERDKLREELATTMRPVVAEVIADATRPYKRLNLWLGITVAVLAVLSIVQWLAMP